VIEDELLAAILAAPDDDAPRLVLADWLSERGDPRGEQIAVEVALARAAPDAPDRGRLAERAAELRTSIGKPTIDGLAVELRSTRGMIEHASLALEALLARERDLFAVAPLLRSVEVTGVDESGLAALLARAWFPRLRSLEMSWHVPGAAVIAVARSPAARGLERISIHHAGLPISAFTALGASEHLAGLRELDLSLSGATDEAVVALLAPGALPSLATLGLTNNRIGTVGCQAIAGYVAPLQRLHVGWNRLGHRGVSAIAGSPFRRGLAYLDLDHVQTGERGCAALADAGLQLETLSLQKSKIDDAGARRLLHSRSLTTSLRVLDLTGNNLSTDVVAELRARFGARVLV
jgi:uncharacterized protein (TIGR02996 family)